MRFMHRRLALVLTALALTRPLRAGDAEDVRAAFDVYRAALLKNDGDACAAVVDRGTIAYYQRMRNLAVRGTSLQVRKLPIMDKLIVLRMRHQVPLARLEAMDGRAALAHGVTEGWIGKESVGNASLGAVEVRGTRAAAVFVVEGKPTPFKIRARREPGGWRIDLRSLFEPAEAAFASLREASGRPEDDFIVDLVERLSNKPVPATIWDPPR
jgi:hypothetical protein